MAKFKCPYTYPHRSREAMIDYILSNGGYHRVGERWPLAYNVKAYGVDLDFDHLWTKYAKDYLPRSYGRVVIDGCREIAERDYENCKDNLFDWALEDARSNVTNCDTYRMLWDAKDVVPKTEFGFCGRSGGYICVMRFDWTEFRGWSQERFEEWLREPESNSMKDIRLLYKMCRQWEVDWTSKKASEEVEHQAAFRLFTDCESEWEALAEASLGPKLEGRRIRIRPAGAI